MSYNITHWETVKLNELTLPADVVSITYLDPRTVIFSCGEGRCKGILKEGNIEVISIGCWGERSGTDFHFLLKEIFPHATGQLIAWLIWEGGDDITRLVVQDGDVLHRSVDIFSIAEEYLNNERSEKLPDRQ
jgi:hypothetical protein